MGFASIVSGTDTYNPAAEGIYALSTLTFANPRQEVRITGATKNRDGSLSGAITWVLEKDVTFDGKTTRPQMRVTLNPQLTRDFTVADLQKGIKALYDFSQTSGYVNRWAQGES
jgi:hypothetical protein